MPYLNLIEGLDPGEIRDYWIDKSYKLFSADPNIAYHWVLKSLKQHEYEDLVKAGVIDPTKVTRTALANAASVATLLLTSDALVAEKPKDYKDSHGGDYDLY